MSDLSRKNGARWESYIRSECKDLWAVDRAFVSKNWEAPKIKGEHAKREKSKPDFSGFLPDGRYVVFEAKASLVAEPSFPLDRIAPHQMEHLLLAHNSGAIAFVYLLNGSEKFVLPWGFIEAWDLQRKSVPLRDLGSMAKRKGETWLDTWERLILDLERDLGLR